jgi:macrolide transport system ATP-binding/permease protein
MHWLRRLFQRRRDDFSLSIQSHLDEMADELMEEGLSREDAMLQARRAFGNVTLIKEQSQEAWQWPAWESSLADLRFALRQLRRAPAFFITTILVLALGIAASITVFAFVNAALIQPLPYKDPARLVALGGSTPNCPECSLSYLDYRDWKQANSSFRSIEIWSFSAFLLHHFNSVEALRAARVSGGFFTTLGVTPAIGRLFTPADDTPATPRTAVLPYLTWQRSFGGRTDIIGQSIQLDNNTYTVIGVLPREFQFALRAAEVWVTIHDQDDCDRDRSCRQLNALARLKDGVSVTAAMANMKAVAAQLQKQYPESNEGQGAFVEPLTKQITGEIQPLLLLLLAGSALLLLIACVNVAGLLLVRAENRRREMAVRNALGGSMARLARQLMIEAALMVSLASFLGIGVARGTVSVLASLIPERILRGMPYFQSVPFDHRVTLFATAIALLAWGMCTVAPFSRLFGSDLHARLANGARGSSTGWRRFGSNLVVVEMALAIVLLVAAGILGKSFYRILRVELNFNPAHLATLEIDAASGYDTKDQQLALSRQVIAAVGRYPGVESVAIVKGQLPVSCNCDLHAYSVQGRPRNATQQLALVRTATSGYLATLEAQLLQGRLITETDDASHPLVAVINQTMAHQLFDSDDPIGRTIVDESLSPAKLYQVVGVIGDIREGNLDEPIYPAAYFAFNQNPDNYVFLVARTTQDSAAALPGIVAAIRGANPGIGLRNEFTMNEHLHYGAAYYFHSSAAWLAGSFAGCAFVLGVIGLYGVIAYSVSQRTCEIGIRMALGAQRSSIRRLIIGEAALLVLFGLTFGIAASFFTVHFLRTLLFGVSSWDFSVFAVISLVFTAAALAAAWIPADRAASTDPMRALHDE